MTRLCIFLTISLILVLNIAHATVLDSGRVVISEVLANPSQSESDAEWVELVNTATDSISLSGWSFIANNDTTQFPASMILAPGEYLIIARELLDGSDADTESFESIWGDGSGVWGDHAQENYMAMDVSMILTNTSGSVAIRDTYNVTQSFSWNSDAGNGISWEKIDLTASDNVSNWSASFIPTPGAINSVSPRDSDAAIYSADIVSVGSSNDYDTIRISITNKGIKNVASAFTVFEDSNNDSLFQPGELLQQDSVALIKPQNSYTILIPIQKRSSGYHSIGVFLNNDDNNLNNTAFADIYFGLLTTDVVINEIMFDTHSDDEEPEWIELYNRGKNTVDLKDWMLGDDKSTLPIISRPFKIRAGSYIVITSDTSGFVKFYGNLGITILQQSGWKALNNDKLDHIVVQDPSGREMEHIVYDDDWMGSAKNEKGRSLERINPTTLGMDSRNWWACKASSGSTPGRQNSIYSTTVIENTTHIWADPATFSPDGDYFDDKTTIKYTVPYKSLVNMLLFDVNGRLLKTFLKDEATVNEGKIVWKGKGDNNKVLDIGIYILFIRAKAIDSGLISTHKNTVVIAKLLH